MKTFKFLNKNEITWRSYSGTLHPLRTLHYIYLKTLLDAYKTSFTDKLPTQPGNRTNQEWYNILKEELNRRHENI